jgi:Sulfotransferase family
MYVPTNVQRFAAPIKRLLIERNLPAPVVIGGVGGSGTRLIVQILHDLGVFMGVDRNASEDAMPLAPIYDRHVNRFLTGCLDPVSLVDDFSSALIPHLGNTSNARFWGWKNPRSIYLLPLLDQLFTGMLFIHVIRDGITMSASHNQAQLVKHGEVVVPPAFQQLTQAEQSLLLWSTVNTAAAAYGTQMGKRYLLLRYEDVCADPEAAACAMAAVLCTSVPAYSTVRIGSVRVRDSVALPQTCGTAWDIASVALKQFGYPC